MIQELNEKVESLEASEHDLKKYIQDTKMSIDDPDARQAAERQKIQDQIAQADVESEQLSSDSDLQLENNKAEGFYDKQCDDYAETEIERTANLNNMQKIITRLLKKGNTAIGTQTDSVEGLEDLETLL